jgi:predicted esterase
MFNWRWIKLSMVFVVVFLMTTLALAFIHSSMNKTSTPAVGSIRCDIWNNLEGAQISDAVANGALSGPPSESSQLKDFELNPAPAAPDACALHGYVVAPLSGSYRFFIAAHDTADLYLSTDETPDHRKNIASVPTPLRAREYTRYSCQTSKPVELVSGKRYFIEALMKNQRGVGHVSVGWSLPNGAVEAPIPGTRLMEAEANIAPPVARRLSPVVTLAPEAPVDFKPGFHQFVRGARVVWPEEATQMSYLLFVPECSRTTGGKLPLLVFLHGNTHQGTDLQGVFNEGPASYLLTDPALHDWFPMVALFPQLPEDWRWDTQGAAQSVNGLIKQLCVKYSRIDIRRIYLTGLSMGGKGAWLVALDSPDTFAAMTTFSAVAVQPRTAKIKLAGLKNIHIVCGADDWDFADGSKEMFDVLHTALGDRVQFTSVPHQGHSVWIGFYPQREFYEELMRYSR